MPKGREKDQAAHDRARYLVIESFKSLLFVEGWPLIDVPTSRLRAEVEAFATATGKSVPTDSYINAALADLVVEGMVAKSGRDGRAMLYALTDKVEGAAALQQAARRKQEAMLGQRDGVLVELETAQAVESDPERVSISVRELRELVAALNTLSARVDEMQVGG